MILIIKSLVSITMLAVCICAIDTFCCNPMLLVLCAVSVFILLSSFFNNLYPAVIVRTRTIGGMALSALFLLLIAAIIKKPHLSEASL